MGFVCPLILKLMATLWALGFLQQGGPNISFPITTTSCSNAVLLIRITYEVARMNLTMCPSGISAENNELVLPSVTFTMEELRLGNLATLPRCAHAFHQAMGTHNNLRNVFAVPERRCRRSKITCGKHLLDVHWRSCKPSGWNHLAILKNLNQEASLS